MDYGKKILEKHGWKEGQGLGKESSGLVKPIKANLKFDNLGFGADLAASDFNNHWWNRVYQEASANLEIQEDNTEGASRINAKSENNEVEITTNSYSLKKLKKSTERDTSSYANFLKSATLTNEYKEVENKEKLDIGHLAFKSCRQLSDEELFRACGGRTAHKGARHGLKLTGKLSRIEQQDQELLAKMQLQRNNSDSKSDIKKSQVRENVLMSTPKVECKLKRTKDSEASEQYPLRKRKIKDNTKDDQKSETTELSKKKKIRKEY